MTDPTKDSNGEDDEGPAVAQAEAETAAKYPVSSTNTIVRGSSTMNKGSESDTDPPERAIEESHPLEDAASARHAELTALHANVRACTPMVLKGKNDAALQREESLKAELDEESLYTV